MSVSIFLNFPGNCAEAFRFYEQHLGAKLGNMLSYGSSPMADEFPQHWQDKIINAELVLQNQRITGSDALPDHYAEPAGVALLLSTDNADQARRIFEVLAQEGDIQLPMRTTFWSPCYGIVKDKFGITWKLNAMS